MIPVSLRTLAKILSAKLIGADNQIISVTTDSRKVTNGCLFVALKGTRFDAHDFAAHSIAAGAVALLVNQFLVLKVPQLVVADTHLALGQLASWVRQQLSVRVVALTGSSGKTLVKEMTTVILNECGKVLCTNENLNNDIGVALTLLRLKPLHDFAVVELGANHPGEIAYATALTCPCTALINNLAYAHLEGFGSFCGIARAKAEIFIGLPANGIAIINADNNELPCWKSILAGKTIWRFSMQDKVEADFFASEIKSDFHGTQFILNSPLGCVDIVMPLLGRHNVANALAAAALAISVGASLTAVERGLKQIKAVPGRVFPIVLATNKLLLDDSYNANVGSMIAAASVLAEMPGYRVMVVGDMAELGVEAQACHRQVGKAACLAGIDKVISVGDLSRVVSEESSTGEHYQDKAAVTARLIELLAEYEVITILVKGSRLAAMEQIVYALQEKTLC